MAASVASDDFEDIRAAVRSLCSGFPGEYWRTLDRERAYPADFVQALTDAGYLAALIPEDYGGSGLPLAAAAAILEEIQKAGCNAAADSSRAERHLKKRNQVSHEQRRQAD